MATNLTRAPYPTDANGTVSVKLGGYVANGLTTTVIDAYKLPWSAKVKKVYYHYVGGTADIDAVTLVTVTGSKTIVAAADMSDDLAMVAQTLHADMSSGEYVIPALDVITLSVDTSGANEAGTIIVQIELEPAYG